MKEENKKIFKNLLKNYLEEKSLFLNKEIWGANYSFDKFKGERGDYQIESFIKDFSLGMTKSSENYKLWKYIYQKDIALSYEIINSYVKYPSDEYTKKKYIYTLFDFYTNHKKDNKVLWLIINNKTFLNNNILIIQELFEENILSGMQKKEVMDYYIEYVDKNKKLNTLENKRIITLLNKKLLKPLEIDLIKERKLEIKSKSETCVYFEVSVIELMGYSLKLSEKFSEHLLSNFSRLLPKVTESETSDVIERKKMCIQDKTIEGYGYAILTKLDESIVKKIFNYFVDSYIDIIDTDCNFPKKEDMLDCLRLAVIKSRKDNLENKLININNKIKINKI